MKKIRILAASDLHGMSSISKELAKKAEKNRVDLVVLAGDILNFGEYAKNMIKPFVEKKEEILFVPGNHDTEEAVEEFTRLYKIRNIDGGYLIQDEIGFFGCGGSTLPAFPYSLTERQIYSKLRAGFEKIKNSKKKIMITHMHPAGGMIEKFSFPGSESIRKAIENFKPDIHICGHIHELEGMEEKTGRTVTISVGKRGAVIEI